MKKPLLAVALALPCLALSACMVPVGPVEVARFHLPDTAALGHGSIAVVAGQGMDPGSLEIQSYQSALAHRLSALGYSVGDAGGAQQIAEIRLSRSTIDQDRQTSVGMSAAGSTHASAVGLGVTIPLGRSNASRTATDLAVVIRDRASGKALWEGRASFTVSSTSPLAQTQLAAPKLVDALLADFPGESGKTVLVP